LAKPNGFLHGQVWDHQGGFCSVGALLYITNGQYWSENYSERYNAACAALRQHIPDMGRKDDDDSNVVVFNNTHSQAEVVDLFNKTLADLGGLG
jgi:hypothetical protein